MKKTLLCLATSLVLAGALSSTASAQSAYNGYTDRDRDGIEDRYDRDIRVDSRYADPRYAQQGGMDYDRDGVADRYDNDDDNDGVSDRYDANDRDPRDGRAYAQAGRYEDGRYGDDDRDGRHDSRHDSRYDSRDGRHDNGHHKGWAKQRYRAGRYVAPRNYRAQQWQVGSRLPQGYYGSNYYVNSSAYGLAPAPRGYRWNRVGNDVYLVSTSNGAIRDVMYSLFY
jgi:Ni/Co efflux regulator RcnB